MAEAFDIEGTVLVAESHQVQGGQVTGRIVQEHVFRAGIRGADVAALRASVPIVNGGVVLHARIGAGPSRLGNLAPKVAGLDGTGGFAVGSADQIPIAVVFNRAQEIFCDANRVVGVLARDRQIGVAVPIGVIGGEFDLFKALLGKSDNALDSVVGHLVLARSFDGFLQLRIILRIEAIHIGAVNAGTNGHDGVQVLGEDLRTGDQRGDLLFLNDFPVDVVFDIGVIDIQRDHLGRTAGGAA